MHLPCDPAILHLGIYSPTCKMKLYDNINTWTWTVIIFFNSQKLKLIYKFINKQMVHIMIQWEMEDYPAKFLQFVLQIVHLTLFYYIYF